MREAERVADEERAVAYAALEVRRIEQEVRVALHVLELRLRLVGHVAGVAQKRVRRLPGIAHRGRVERAAADVEPVALRHVPAVAAEVVEQHELGLAVVAEARARDRAGIGLQLELLHADRAARPLRLRACVRPGSACRRRRRGSGRAASPTCHVPSAIALDRL